MSAIGGRGRTHRRSASSAPRARRSAPRRAGPDAGSSGPGPRRGRRIHDFERVERTARHPAHASDARGPPSPCIGTDDSPIGRRSRRTLGSWHTERRIGQPIERRAVHAERGAPSSGSSLDRPERRNALCRSRSCRRSSTRSTRSPPTPTRGSSCSTGTGPAFSAGHDLAEMVERPARRSSTRELFATCVELMERLHAIPQPVIAKVHGVATAAGCQLVAACDLAVASDRRTLRDTGREHRAVLLDADGAGLALDRPQARARDAVHRRHDRRARPRSSGASSTASCRPPSSTRRPTRSPSAIARASAVRRRARQARVLRAGSAPTRRDAYALTCGVMVENAQADDAHEGMRAFLEKRAPSWRGA